MYLNLPRKLNGYERRKQKLLRLKIAEERASFKNMAKPFVDRRAKLANMKQLEETKSFQRDFNKMRGWLKVNDTLVKQESVFKPNNTFARTKKSDLQPKDWSKIL